MNEIHLKKSHTLYSAADDIRQICKPLQDHFNVDHFSYVKVNPDLSRIHLDTSPEWIEHFYKNAYRYYKAGGLTEGKHWQSSYTILRELQGEEACILDAAEYNVYNGIVIADHYNDVTELSFFAFGRKFHSDTKHLIKLLNNIDQLKKFTKYFKETAHKHISTPNNEIVLPFLSPTKNLETLYGSGNESTATFLHKYQKLILTAKEIECCRYLKDGFSTQEISISLNRSTRTIEKHISNIKEKTKTRHLVDLMRWINEYI